ncbi:MAG TPA: 3-hydroxybutyrate dehydrogenase [Burkholderiaceae bacterium]|nr:3-hydroxybutyrate dehydrogenase [Burkholderiaceae bacterium]
MLQDKVALVTGSTSGIGLGIAHALAASGAHIVLNGFGDAQEIEALRAGIAQRYGVQAVYQGADMARAADIEAMMAAVLARFGRIDIVVNNAGIQHVAEVDAFPVEKWDAILAINLSAVFHTTRLALPSMKRHHWGRIINVASVHGLVASAQKSAYVAAKHGVVGLTKAVALELAQTGVTCNAICPGWVLTPLVQDQVDALAARRGIGGEQARAQLLAQKQPSGEFVTPEQLGALAVFFCSDAAREVRGVAWNMDGGWVAQ